MTGKNTSRSSRSTVGTATETNDYLRLLFAKIGHTFCRKCGREVQMRQSAEHGGVALGPAAGDAVYGCLCPGFARRNGSGRGPGRPCGKKGSSAQLSTAG